MRHSLLRKLQAGDTIVEVLISIAVVSAVLMGAFLVTSKSTSGVRNSQEHGEMLQVLQGQVEHVRALAVAQTTSTGGIFASGNFCIDATASPPARVPSSSGACHNIDSRYNVSISYDSTSNVFTFTGTWDGITGGSQKENLSYRVYSSAPFAIGDVITNPSEGGDNSGDAFFNNGGTGAPTCGVSIGLPPCNTINPNGYYEYTWSVVNQSQNDPSLILGCTWDWGDGTVQTFGPSAPECQYGTKIKHVFPRVDPEGTYPDSCNKVKYKATLTMRVAGVTPDPSYSSYAVEPYCCAAKH